MQETIIRKITDRQVIKRNKILFLLVGTLFITHTSCSDGEVYFRYHHIERGKWYSDSALTFTMDSIGVNPAARHDLSIELTTADIYHYKDIWMQVEHNLIDTIYRCDTLQFRLTDDYGKWLGSGTGGLHQISLPYKSDIPLDTSRLYILKIKQIMKDDPLIGVEKVGIKIIEKI